MRFNNLLLSQLSYATNLGCRMESTLTSKSQHYKRLLFSLWPHLSFQIQRWSRQLGHDLKPVSNLEFVSGISLTQTAAGLCQEQVLWEAESICLIPSYQTVFILPASRSPVNHSSRTRGLCCLHHSAGQCSLLSTVHSLLLAFPMEHCSKRQLPPCHSPFPS